MESKKKKGRGVEYEQKEISGVSDVICSSCTRQESVICSTKAADFIRQNRAGQGRAALWLVSAQQTFLRVNGWQKVSRETDIIQSDFKKTTLLLRNKLLATHMWTLLCFACQLSQTS